MVADIRDHGGIYGGSGGSTMDFYNNDKMPFIPTRVLYTTADQSGNLSFAKKLYNPTNKDLSFGYYNSTYGRNDYFIFEEGMTRPANYSFSNTEYYYLFIRYGNLLYRFYNSSIWVYEVGSNTTTKIMSYSIGHLYPALLYWKNDHTIIYASHTNSSIYSFDFETDTETLIAQGLYNYSNGSSYKCWFDSERGIWYRHIDSSGTVQIITDEGVEIARISGWVDATRSLGSNHVWHPKAGKNIMSYYYNEEVKYNVYDANLNLISTEVLSSWSRYTQYKGIALDNATGALFMTKFSGTTNLCKIDNATGRLLPGEWRHSISKRQLPFDLEPSNDIRDGVVVYNTGDNIEAAFLKLKT